MKRLIIPLLVTYIAVRLTCPETDPPTTTTPASKAVVVGERGTKQEKEGQEDWPQSIERHNKAIRFLLEKKILKGEMELRFGNDEAHRQPTFLNETPTLPRFEDAKTGTESWYWNLGENAPHRKEPTHAKEKNPKNSKAP